MPTKKKTKAAAAPSNAPPDPRQPLEPTPANLAAALKALKVVLADIPVPDPIIEEPEPEPEPPVAVATPSSDGDSDLDSELDGGDAPAAGDTPLEVPVAKKPEPVARLPRLDFIEALLHVYFATGLPCGYGQEVRRRIEGGFVDRNEFRVTEAFEVEELLRDLEIPDLFDRCLSVRESIAQIYNDQNGVHMTFLHEAGISERNMFFQRVPAVKPHVIGFLTNLLTIEEICFSEKSTVRAQQRFGLDPKSRVVVKFIDELRACLKPYGHVPVSIGPHGSNGKPSFKHVLSPACILARLGPVPRGRRS